MPFFSANSRAVLATCHPGIQVVFHEVIKWYDCTALRGIRTIEEQAEFKRKGFSKTLKSEHLAWENVDGVWVSRAADVAPYPVVWTPTRKNLARFYHFGGYVLATAKAMDIDLRWGGDWDGDRDFSDQTFDDLVHFELRPHRDAYR